MNTFLLIVIAILLITIIVLLTKNKNSIYFEKYRNNEPTISTQIKVDTEVIETKPEHVYYKIHENEIEQNKLSSNYSEKKLDIEDKSSLFYDKNVVITGSFMSYSRSDIAELVYSKGAAIKGGITSTTDIVIVGSINPGPAKLIKIENLINSGSKLKVIQEDEFVEISKKEKLNNLK